MSAFGFYPKDNLVDAIEELAKAEIERGKSPREVIESILEANTYGINQVLFKLLEE